MLRKTGILLINLGTPDRPTKKGVRKYLTQFLTDGRVIDYPWLSRQLLVRGVIIPRRNANSTSLYQQLWTSEGSPLKIYGEAVASAIKQRHPEISVALGMRYQHPSISSAIASLMEAQVTDIVVFPLFPHYASASTGSSFEEVMRVIKSQQVIPSLYFIQDYYDHDAFLDVIEKRSQSFDLAAYDHILFSYHGIPQRQLKKADLGNHCLASEDCCQQQDLSNRHCYSAQSYATTFALAKKLNLAPDRYTTCFQSRLGRDPWTQPYTSAIIQRRAEMGDKRLLVFSPAFVADCLETTIEVGVEYQEEFTSLGGDKIDLVPSLNDDPAWIEAIMTIISERINL
ncbi:MAG: ferrochelatase [Saprospiraceae bacterium]|nr:ferrochelatase [Saprospiraceae bacterium]